MRHWNNYGVGKSRAALALKGGVWRSAGTKLGVTGIAITTGDALLSGEFKTSQGVNVLMTGFAIAVPGVGSIVAGVYFLADLGFDIGDRIDAVTSGTHELYDGIY